MLTPNDVHQIVGLLSFSFSPEDVDIELGSMVLDTASDTKRDVDITIAGKDDLGNQLFLIGLEVKDHSRRLDVSHVEQLVIKLMDMPSINEKGIVSSSGYTRPAIKKAKAHGIDLYRFENWDYKNSQLDHVKLQFDVPLHFSKFQWQGNPNVNFSLENGATENTELKISEDTPVYFAESQGEKTSAKNLGQLAKNLVSKMPDELTSNQRIQKNVVFPLKINCNISDKPYMIFLGKKIFLHKAIIQGHIMKVETTYLPICKALRKQNCKKPLAACLLYELDNNLLMGLSFYPRDVGLITIPIKNRNLNKIKQMKLSRNKVPEKTLTPSVAVGIQ